MPTPPIPLAHIEGPVDPARKYRLLELVRRRMHELRYRPGTIKAYVFWARRYVLFNDRRHPRDLGEVEVAPFSRISPSGEAWLRRRKTRRWRR